MTLTVCMEKKPRVQHACNYYQGIKSLHGFKISEAVQILQNMTFYIVLRFQGMCKSTAVNCKEDSKVKSNNFQFFPGSNFFVIMNHLRLLICSMKE